MKTQEEGGQAKREVTKEINPAGNLILDFMPPELWASSNQMKVEREKDRGGPRKKEFCLHPDAFRIQLQHQLSLGLQPDSLPY